MTNEKTTLKKGAKVWAKIADSHDFPHAFLQEFIDRAPRKVRENLVLNDAKDGVTELLGLVEIGKIQDPGHLLVRSSIPVGEGTIRVGSCGTTGPTTCEWCGTEWNEGADPENGGDYSVSLSDFNGLQIVVECCGKLFDILFAELGRAFFEEYLRRVISHPFEKRYETALILGATKKIRDKAVELKNETDEALDGIEFVPRGKPF